MSAWSWLFPAKWVKHDILVGDLTRTYYLFVPKGLSGPAPLVLWFHGGATVNPLNVGGDALKALANQRGWIACIPYGVESPQGTRSWAIDAVPGAEQGWQEANDIDDLGFVDQLLIDVWGNENIDPDRVYAMGMSKGAMMTYHAAKELGAFAAIAAVAGTLASEITPLSSAAGISLLHIHGTEDQNVPYLGGGDGVNWPPVIDGLNWWCDENGLPHLSPDPDPENWTYIAPDTYSQSVQVGTKVEAVGIVGGGHEWPVSPFDATNYIADFFEAHGRS